MFAATASTTASKMMVRYSAVSRAAAAAATTTTSRTMVTTTASRRLATQGGLLRLAAAATGGIVVVVGGGGTMMMNGSNTTATGKSAIGSEWLTVGSWWQTTTTSSQEESTSSATDSAESSNSSSTGNTNILATSAASNNNNNDNDNDNNKNSSLWDRFFGGSGSSSHTPPEKKDNHTNTVDQDHDYVNEEADFVSETCHNGPGKRVMVKHEGDLIDSLPLMSLAEVKQCTTAQKMLVTYEGIVYDVTQFVNDHPGGAELIKTAAGLDLDHFFGNYTVHGQTASAAQWLAPLAVGKLSPEEAVQSRDETTPQVHVERRAKILHQKRRKLILVVSTLPFWMTLRSVIGWIGWFVPPLGRLLAWAVPVTVPGLSKGSEPLLDAAQKQQNDSPYTVAVIGGGIAGCGAAWALSLSGFDVTLYEAREHISGNARTFSWDFSPFRGRGVTVESCVSVTAWPPLFYKNYTCLLKYLGVETVHQPLSWFLNSKVPGYEGVLWESDPSDDYPGSLRKIFAKDFDRYEKVVNFSRRVTRFFTLAWAPWRWDDKPSMYDTHQGLGLLNPLTVVPLYSLYKVIGGSDAWWNIVFTPQYTASFLVDELRPFPAVFGPLIEDQIPLLPNKTNTWQGQSSRSPHDSNITTCVTWKDAGKGIRNVFDLLVKDVTLKENTRIREVQVLSNGKKRIFDENDSYIDVDRVIFACPANAVGNIFKGHTEVMYANTILSTPVYADDHHPSTGHMHAVMHSDGSVIPADYREECLKRASNYVEITQLKDGSLNIENQYNFGVQTPGPGIYDLPLDEKPVMLISHALGDGKEIDPKLIRGTGNHARAHPLYSGWNVAAQLSLRLIQGRDGIYYCSNWTTPGNCHDMSFLSGIIVANAVGAQYPFENEVEAKKDFLRLKDLML